MKLVSIMSLFFSLVAFAGGVDAGGGGAFVCRYENGAIINSELLDLWEARKIHQYQFESANESAEVILEKALQKLTTLDFGLGLKVRAEIMNLQGKWVPTPSDVALAPPSDAQNGFMKPGCPLEGMMYYDGDYDRVVVNEQIFSKLLTQQDKAAAYFHEGFYKHFRQTFAESTSKNTRRMTGCLFSKSQCLSEKTFVNAIDSLKKMKIRRLKCTSPDIEYYYWSESTVSNNFLIRRFRNRIFDQALLVHNSDSGGHASMSLMKNLNYSPLYVFNRAFEKYIITSVIVAEEGNSFQRPNNIDTPNVSCVDFQ